MKIPPPPVARRLPVNQIICGDCKIELSKILNNSVDMIFVDPPYGKAGIYLYEIIAKEAARILKPGKFAVFYFFQIVLNILIIFIFFIN